MRADELKRYFEMADELRDTGRDLMKLAKPGEEKALVLEVAGTRMLTAGNEFEKLFRRVADEAARMEDDGR